MKDIPYFTQALAYVMKKHRDRLKLPRRKIAETLDADITTVRNLEHGIHVPSSTTLFLLAKAFGVEPSAFVKEIDDQIIYLTDRDSSEESTLADKDTPKKSKMKDKNSPKKNKAKDKNSSKINKLRGKYSSKK